ncbi:MAG: hypothetical protein MUD01_10940 [Chloroflexaceae bacterium]|jgi:hypothetical protein|nr:hypothetical protein [Chloroflexaceae bacterium]
MTKTIVGLFDAPEEARGVVHALKSLGVEDEAISVVANTSHGDMAAINVAEGEERQVSNVVGMGAVGGTLVGGTLGLAVGLGALAIPGIGPVLAVGPLTAAIGSVPAVLGTTALGAGLGAATGGLVGALADVGVPEDEANLYAEGVRRGGILVSAQLPDALVSQAAAVMQQHHAVDVSRRGADWRETGWTHFDPAGEPFQRQSGENPTPNWGDSSKVGTAAGGMSGAATGAALGAVGGPVGAVVGGAVGALAGAGLGAAGDAAGEGVQEGDEYRSVGDYQTAREKEEGEAAYKEYETDFHTHYLVHYGRSGYSYEEFSPAYKLGYQLARSHNAPYVSWSKLEPEARQRWEVLSPGTWERFKDAVYHAWYESSGGDK